MRRDVFVDKVGDVDSALPSQELEVIRITAWELEETITHHIRETDCERNRECEEGEGEGGREGGIGV